ncbi:MAG: glycosyltransferase family 2 protein [Alphaproteobacteria bacterium]|nr:glycosyltransferase family 2 protein [Alphaproteobacteria bacterium]
MSGSDQNNPPTAQLSVVIPTFKERGNVAELVRRLDAALAGIAWEAIFVDDNSPDGTAAAVKEIAGQDPRVRCLRRVGRRGLAGACIEGILSSAAPYVAVIDADLQHDEKVLPAMLGKLASGEADLVAATRYVAGGSAASFSEGRGAISRLATKMTHRMVGTALSDPMSGFFMLRRDRFDEIAPRLSPAGFKILLDIAATAGPALRIAEQAYSFGERQAGESKFNIQIGVEFLGLLLAKMTGDVVNPRFIFFALVGSIGLVIHLVVLFGGLLVHENFPAAQIIATFAAMTSNFLLNNELTYRDRRLKGWSMLRGFVLFCLVCSVGVLANVDLASWLYGARSTWWVAGAVGAVMSVLWNYAMSTLFVWRAR